MEPQRDDTTTTTERRLGPVSAAEVSKLVSRVLRTNEDAAKAERGAGRMA